MYPFLCRKRVKISENVLETAQKRGATLSCRTIMRYAFKYKVTTPGWSKLAKRACTKCIASKFARDFDSDWQRVNAFPIALLWYVSIDCEIQPEKKLHFLFSILLFWESFNTVAILWNHWSVSGGVLAKCTSPNENFNQIENWKCNMFDFRLIFLDRITYVYIFVHFPNVDYTLSRYKHDKKRKQKRKKILCGRTNLHLDQKLDEI